MESAVLTVLKTGVNCLDLKYMEAKKIKESVGKRMKFMNCSVEKPRCVSV